MEMLTQVGEFTRSPKALSWEMNLKSAPDERTKILLVHDGSRQFGYELADLKKAGLPSTVELEVLTVADLLLPPMYFTGGDTPDLEYYFNGELRRNYSTTYTADLSQRLEQASQEAARAIKNTFPFWTVRNSVSTDFAVPAVLGRASRWRPDLVVIGSAELSWFERRKLRSLTRRLVAEARCSVRVARASAGAENEPSRIMIGFDGSRHSEAALASVRRREWLAGSEVYLVSCVEPLITDELDWAHDYVELDRRRLAEQVNSARRELEQAGLKVHTIIPVGNPAQTIVDEARKHKIEAIFLGTRELNAIENLLSGSVSATVAARADCSVEIARAANEPQSCALEQRLAA